MTKIILTGLGLLLLYSGVAYGHAGKTDSNGGHFDRKTGEYHCHKEPCFSNQEKTDQATQDAADEELPVSALYDRDDWPHWVDFDGDCQNARAEALIAASSVPVKFRQEKGCVVDSGSWFDPYTGNTFEAASELDIDHIVPLKEAHISGGDSWSRAKRQEFANDPENILVVSASENRSKGAKDIAEWLPDTVTFRCDYVKKWAHIKTKYELTSDSKETQVMSDLMKDC
ncbi:MAG: HNH endonuclease [Gammaproteobacteria bacterium]|nr:HNH endonuclease [Gammaproteobacteria bacterium]